jgi:hypothetical protein
MFFMGDIMSDMGAIMLDMGLPLLSDSAAGW